MPCCCLNLALAAVYLLCSHHDRWLLETAIFDMTAKIKYLAIYKDTWLVLTRRILKILWKKQTKWMVNL